MHPQVPPLPPQYAVLLTMVLTIFIKYVLHAIDLQSENPWDSKAVYMLYTELLTGARAPPPPVTQSGAWGGTSLPQHGPIGRFLPSSGAGGRRFC